MKENDFIIDCGVRSRHLTSGASSFMNQDIMIKFFDDVVQLIRQLLIHI